MITLQTINPNDLIFDGPAAFNSNFEEIKSHIDDLEELLIYSSKTLKLTNKTTITNGSIESNAITLVATTGNVITVAPDGGSAVATLGSDGKLTVTALVIANPSATSVFQNMQVTGTLAINGQTTVNAIVKFTGANAQLAFKYTVANIIDAMTGSGATNPLDVHTGYNVHLNYYNGGVGLGNNAEVNLDTSNFIEGQIIRFHCYRTNVNGQRFYNGVLGAEVFAYIDPTAGYISIDNGTKPTFSPNASPDNQSWMVCQWTNIGGGSYRLVILDSKNVDNVS